MCRSVRPLPYLMEETQNKRGKTRTSHYVGLPAPYRFSLVLLFLKSAEMSTKVNVVKIDTGNDARAAVDRGLQEGFILGGGASLINESPRK